MNTAELLPPQAMRPEAETQLPPVEVAHVGSAIMHREVAIEGTGLTQQELDQDVAALEAVANGVDVRPEDAGRIHNIEEAYKAAQIENEIFDVYDEAKRENEIFDAHTEAIKEDETHTQAAEEAAKAEAEQAAAQAQENAVEQQAKLEEQIAASDVRQQAESVLRSVGYEQPLSATSQVRKDYETGNLMIVDGNDIKVLEPQINGKTQITEYRFDDQTNTLSIDAKGIGLVTAKVGEYTPDDTAQYTGKAITLPPAVAKLVGSKTATPMEN